MKKILFLVIALIAFSEADAQRRLDIKDFRTWSVQANLNTNIGNTDISQNKPFYTDVDMNYGYGIRVTKFLTHNLGLSLDNYRSRLSGSNEKWSFESDIRYQTALIAQLQTGNIRYMDAFNKWQLYGYIGYGTVNFQAEAKSKLDPTLDTEVSRSSQIVPIGLGLKYQLAENATLNFEYSMNRVDGDKLDGYDNYYTNYDSYNRFSVGFSWTFGSKYDLNLEWHDPRPRPVAPTVRKDTIVIIQKVPAGDSLSSLGAAKKIDEETLSALRDSIRLELLSMTIYYDFNKWKIPSMYISPLENVALELLNNPFRVVTVDSYCDTVGTDENNATVVAKRAGEVKTKLVEMGVKDSMIVTTLHGKEAATSNLDAYNRKTVIGFKKD